MLLFDDKLLFLANEIFIIEFCKPCCVCCLTIFFFCVDRCNGKERKLIVGRMWDSGDVKRIILLE